MKQIKSWCILANTTAVGRGIAAVIALVVAVLVVTAECVRHPRLAMGEGR